MITKGSPPWSWIVATFWSSGFTSNTPGRGLIAPRSASIRTNGGRSGATAERFPSFQSSPARVGSAAPTTWLVTRTVGPAMTLRTDVGGLLTLECSAELEHAEMKREQTTATSAKRREAAACMRGVGADTVGAYKAQRPSFAVFAKHCSTQSLTGNIN